MSMKLNLTKEQVRAISLSALDIGLETLLADKNGCSEYLTVKQFFNDWLAMHAELEVRAELIEKLEKALKGLSGLAISHGMDEEYFIVISAVEEWRKK